MKRRIEVRAHGITITATIDSRGEVLAREEVEEVRDELADRLMRVAHDLPHFRTPLSRMLVR